MVKRNRKKCATGGREREDRAANDQESFEPLNLEIKYPDTAILLLRSPERPILLAAASALAQFGEKARGNLERLFDLDVVESVLALVEHDDLFTGRFALKLLALMSAVQNVQTHLLRCDRYTLLFTEMLRNSGDNFLEEYASRILAELTSDPRGCARFLEKNADAGFLLDKIERAADPDMKKNCVEIVDNLLKDLGGLSCVTGSKNFSFATIYELLKQPYPIVQELALDVIERLAMHNRDDRLQEDFRRSAGLQYLLDLLDNDEWADLHAKVIRILGLSCDNAKTADLMNSTDATRRLFGFMENSPSDELRFDVLSALISLAESSSGKKALHSRGLIRFMLSYVETRLESRVHACICRGVAKMTRYGPAADEIVLENPVGFVLKLLDSEEAKWSERQDAAYALKELFQADYRNCINFLDCNGQTYLMRLLDNRERSKIPWETQVTIVEATAILADYPPLARDLIDYDLFNLVCSNFEPDDASDELKIACCHLLSRFAVHQAEARRAFVRVDLCARLYNLILSAESMPVRNAATTLLLQLCADPLLANLCNQHGYLVYMMKNRSAARFIATWDACIEALFNADLPMKLAYTGRLELRDVTRDGFYAMRRSSCPFPVLEELFRLKLCPLEPIYVANFSESRARSSSSSSIEEEDDDDDCLASKQVAFEAAREAMRRESLSKGIRVSEGTINAWLELKFGRLQTDRNLIGYLESFKGELAALEGESGISSSRDANNQLIDISRIASRARLLAKFVARQLSGLQQESSSHRHSCIEQQLELHLRSIKDSIETSVIPLGLLRVGSYLERALLFKVMADRIALPVSLTRGSYGVSWVEIAVPATLIGSNQGASGALLPIGRHLRENFIVDLMNAPGELIPIRSARAQRYVGQRRRADVCCGQRDSCGGRRED